MKGFVPVPRALLVSDEFKRLSHKSVVCLLLLISKDYNGEQVKKGNIHLKPEEYGPFMCRNSYDSACTELEGARLIKLTRRVPLVNGYHRKEFTIPILISHRGKDVSRPVKDDVSSGDRHVSCRDSHVSSSGHTSNNPSNNSSNNPENKSMNNPYPKDSKDQGPDEPSYESFFGIDPASAQGSSSGTSIKNDSTPPSGNSVPSVVISTPSDLKPKLKSSSDDNIRNWAKAYLDDMSPAEKQHMEFLRAKRKREATS